MSSSGGHAMSPRLLLDDKVQPGALGAEVGGVLAAANVIDQPVLWHRKLQSNREQSGKFC
jgi:hypothetical protein